MNKKKLRVDFDWQKWSSTEEDLRRMGRLPASRIMFQTFLINMFESELLRLKNAECVWGPVHSSLGQEAVAAAAMAALRKSDKITGSHRAHHQFLAKALNYVLPENWDPLARELPKAGREVVRRTMAEIMGLAPGYCGGRGGSMHLRYAEAGILGTNAIVGGGIPIATGAAFAEKRLAAGNVVVCFFGDGAVNQGAFHEALNLAGLWRLPIIYFIENNEFAVGTRSTNAAAVRELSVRAASYSMKGLLVPGSDVAAVYEAVKASADGIRRGGSPVVLEVKCWRHYHHAGDLPGSSYGYRTRKEEEEHLRCDALHTLPEALRSAGLASDEDLQRMKAIAREAVRRAVESCIVETEGRCRVRSELWPDSGTAGFGMRSDGRELEALHYSEPEDFPEVEPMKYSDAIAAVTGRWMERDPKVVALGEEIANFGGGAYGATRGLPNRFPEQVINTPISEAGFTGLGLGAAMSGLPTIIEIMFPDFCLVAADQLFNQVAKARHMYGGATDLPLVVRTRIATGNGYGGQHSMDPVGLFALFPGWRIVAPADAFDYIGLFNTAMRSLDPVVILEHHSLYGREFPVPKGILDYCVPFSRARVVSVGQDITVLTYSSMTGRLLNLRQRLQSGGVSVEIIDLRTVDLPGIDFETIGRSLKKTGTVAVVEEAAGAQAIGDRIAAGITVRFFDDLDAPAVFISSMNVPNSVSKVLEAEAMLQDEQIVEAITALAFRQWR
jgi:2-oxoisovalerate dehydrogenase E1 component